jgi:hypothetical protein
MPSSARNPVAQNELRFHTVSTQVFATGNIGRILLARDISVAVSSSYGVQQDGIGERVTCADETSGRSGMTQLQSENRGRDHQHTCDQGSPERYEVPPACRCVLLTVVQFDRCIDEGLRELC